MLRKSQLLAAVVVASLLVAAALLVNPGTATEEKKTDPAVERARKTVRMLDDIYKTTVVLITEKYVNDDNDFPAGSAAIALFEAIGKKGWHEVQLLDATGEPFNPDNVADDDFEREAVKQLKAGKDYYDQIIQVDGVRKLRAATAIPVVLEKCTMCHPHYKDAKPGAAIGLLSYSLNIE